MTAKDLKNAILQLAVQGKLVSQDKNDQSVEDLVACLRAHKQYLLDNNLITIDKKHTAEPFADDDVPFEIPNTWKWMKFADIVNFSSGKTPARQDISSWSSVEYPWVSISDMVDGGITNATAEKISRGALEKYFLGKLIPKGTIIMSFKLTIGKISYLGIDAVHLLPFTHWYYSVGEFCRYLMTYYLFGEDKIEEDIAKYKETVDDEGRQHFEEYYGEKPLIVQAVYVRLMTEMNRRQQSGLHDSDKAYTSIYSTAEKIASRLKVSTYDFLTQRFYPFFAKSRNKRIEQFYKAYSGKKLLK